MTADVTAAQVVVNPSMLDRGRWVMDQFAQAGFQIGPLVGISFSIAGPVERFEEFFQVRAERRDGPPALPEELPTSALPSELREYVTGVLFTRPPDFGPTSF